MAQFNLIFSCARDYERNAEAEAWFNLMAQGDPDPVFLPTGIQGLFLADTSLDPRKFIHNLRDIVAEKDVNYIQFIQKIYPVDEVVEADPDLIAATTKNLVAKHPYCQESGSKYRITIRKRHNPIHTDVIIDAIAKQVQYPVSLKVYDWNIQIEIIGEMAGIAILHDDDIFKPISEKRDLLDNGVQPQFLQMDHI